MGERPDPLRQGRAAPAVARDAEPPTATTSLDRGQLTKRLTRLQPFVIPKRPTPTARAGVATEVRASPRPEVAVVTICPGSMAADSMFFHPRPLLVRRVSDATSPIPAPATMQLTRKSMTVTGATRSRRAAAEPRPRERPHRATNASASVVTAMTRTDADPVAESEARQETGPRDHAREEHAHSDHRPEQLPAPDHAEAEEEHAHELSHGRRAPARG